MSACAVALIVIATILGPITLIFMSVSFGTDHWLEFRVNYAKIPAKEKDSIKKYPTGRYYVSRDRGMFRECYPDNNTEFLQNAIGVVDGYCFNINYDQPSDNVKRSESFMSRLHLNRCFLAFFIIAIVVFLLAYVFGLILCCMRVSRWAYIAGLCAYTSAFSLAAAIAFFHGAEYIERNKLNGGERANEQEFYPSWSASLKEATERSYGWSYALAWVGMILASLAATFYSLAGCYITGDRYEDREILEKHKVRDYPIAMEPVYAVGADPYYNKHYGYPRAYLGPLAPEYYARSYPTISYGDPHKDTWQWREIES
ncbi:unnamed protein product [Candidula unifasciata]|uniref:Uncharacterized protein n=1 Tax=Candidula unifasciata TaxID=100452 RepID=A0A8S3ZA92_9EUPU|nr:unnamed protein product [Candidula unifasciata]